MIYVKLANLNGAQVYINGVLASAATVAPDNSGCWYATEGIAAANLGDAYLFEVKSGDVVLQSVELNVYTYCTALESSETVYAANLAIALKAYGFAAANYAN